MRQSAQCPCCGFYTLGSRGDHEICPVCFWEDDDPGERFDQPAPDRPQGPNGVQLEQARLNYRRFCAAEPKDLPHVRPPLPEERRL